MSYAQYVPDDERDELAHLAGDLRLACMRIARRIRFESPSSVAPHQFSVLCRLADSPMTPRQLAEIEKVSGPSMTRTANSLVARGLVDRAPDPADKRSVTLSLTADGTRTLREVRREREQWMTVRVGALPREEQQVLAQAAEILLRVAAR